MKCYVFTFAGGRRVAPKSVALTGARLASDDDASGRTLVLDGGTQREILTHHRVVHFAIRMAARQRSCVFATNFKNLHSDFKFF